MINHIIIPVIPSCILGDSQNIAQKKADQRTIIIKSFERITLLLLSPFVRVSIIVPDWISFVRTLQNIIRNAIRPIGIFL